MTFHDDEFAKAIVENIESVAVEAERDAERRFEEHQYVTFWRKSAMMVLSLVKSKNEEESGVSLKFMLPDKEVHLDKGVKYDPDTRTRFYISRDELFRLIVDLSIMFSAIKQQKPAKQVSLVHQFTYDGNTETKTLLIAQGQKSPDTVYISLVRDTDKSKYVILMDVVDFYRFLFYLKLAYYEITTGTRQGFSFDWM